jgi:hypothetical protein
VIDSALTLCNVRATTQLQNAGIGLDAAISDQGVQQLRVILEIILRAFFGRYFASS